MHCSLKDLTAHSAPWDLSWWVPLEQGQDSEEEKAETRQFSWVSVACCLLCVLANSCFHAGLQNTAHDGVWPHLSSLMGLLNPLFILSLPKQLLPFPLFRTGWKKRSLLTISTGSLRENLQALANGLKTFSPVQEYEEGAWSLPGGSQTDLCCQPLFTGVGVGQKHAPIRALKANPLPRRGAPGLCLPSQGHRGKSPFSSHPDSWAAKLMAWRLTGPRRIR